MAMTSTMTSAIHGWQQQQGMATGGSAFAGLERETPAPAAGGGGRWEDVTAALRSACGDLGLGGMVKRKEFTLQDSMNALELMSPKMDAGMHLKGFLNIEQRVQRGELAIPPRSAQHLAAVCNAVMGMELAWYGGHSLATSVHSCVHLHSDALAMLKAKAMPLMSRRAEDADAFELLPEDSDESVLAVVALAAYMAILRTCGDVRRLVRLADIYEEEDFSASKLGLPLGEEVNVQELTELIDFGLEVVRLRKAKLPEVGAEVGAVFDEAGCDACERLLLFRRGYVNLLDLFAARDMKGFPEAVAQLPKVRELFDRAGPKRAGASEAERELQAACLESEFDAQVNHEILAAAPPRAGPTVDLDAAHDQFLKHLDDLREVAELRNQTTLFGLYSALDDLSQREASIVPRSLAVLMLYTDNQLALGRFKYDEWILQNMKEFGVPADELGSKACKAFAEAAVKQVYEVLRVLTGNRARQRRNIANLLPGWGMLQQEAEMQDQLVLMELRPELAERDLTKIEPAELREILHFSIYNWAGDWASRLMVNHLLLGFELELYSLYEYDMVFWYLSYVYRRMAENQSDMVAFLDRRVAALEKTKKAAAANKKLLKAIRQQRLQVRGGPRYTMERCLAEVHKLLAEALLRLIMALRCQGKMTFPSYEFGSPQIRFNHRLAPFSGVPMPQPLTFESYEQVTDLSKYEADTLFEHANGFLNRCKEVLSALVKRGALKSPAEVSYGQSLLRVVIGNTLLAARERGRPQGEGASRVAADFSFNARFPVLKVE